MKWSLIMIAILCAEVLYAQAPLFDSPLSSRIANYAIRAELLPREKAVKAEYRLEWKNLSADTVHDLQFHLYLNAFKNEKSTFMRESGGSHRAGTRGTFEQAWGRIDILSMKTAEGTDLKPLMEYIQPDDQNPDDQTVMRIRLPKPVLPGKSIVLNCAFYSKLPKVFARSGYAEPDFYMVAQWYPKIGVRENGKWNCHQYHSNSEFFADFGMYDLTVTVPKNYVTGANGILLEHSEKDSAATYRFYQEDVTDVVWTASPHFVRTLRSVNVPGRKGTIEVTYLLPKEKQDFIAEYEKIVPAMFRYAHEWVGEYPYSNLTIVDPPGDEAMTAGGMEYPTLFTTGSFGPFWFDRWIKIHFREIVTMHEFMHNYFQGMLASNEFEEPWLDEGFTSYLEYRMLKRYFGESGQKGDYAELFGVPVRSLDYHRLYFMTRARQGTVSQTAWEMDDSYYPLGAYSKPVLLLSTLENLLGDSVMVLTLQTYYKRWRFRHPKTQDVFDVFNEVSGRDLSWFFDQFVKSTKTVDYEITKIVNKKSEIDAGWYDADTGRVFVKKPFEMFSSDTGSLYRSSFTVRNNGDGYVPVRIFVRFENGDTASLNWDGKEFLKKFSFDGPSKIHTVILDPGRHNRLDLNWTNNSRTTEPSTAGIWRYTARFWFWTESAFQFLATLI